MSFLGSVPKHLIRDDEEYKVIIHGNIPEGRVKTRFPYPSKLILATSGAHKIEDWNRLGRGDAPGIRSISQMLHSEDSMEREPNAVDIAEGKANISIRNSFEEASERDIAEGLQVVGIHSTAALFEVADDRSLFCDPRLKDHPEFQKYKDASLVNEVFGEGKPWPGHRIKELYDMMGGPLEFLSVLERAHKELPEIDASKYANLSKVVDSGIAWFIRTKDAEKFPELKDGMVIEVVEKGAYFKFPTPQEIAVLRDAGKYADAGLDDFQYMSGETDPLVKLRLDLQNDYFDERSAQAMICKTFKDIYDVPQLRRPRDLNPKARFENRTILTNRAIRSRVGMESIGNPQFEVMQAPLKSLWDLEDQTSHVDGVLLQKPKNKNTSGAQKPDLRRIARKLETLLTYFQVVTHKGLYDPRYTGKPLLTETALQKSIYAAMENFHLRATIHDKPSKISSYVASSGAQDVGKHLYWDPRTYKPADQQIVTDDVSLATLADIQKITDIQDFTGSFALIGSASSTLPAACESAHSITYEAAKQGMTIVDGGGTRFGTIMGEMLRGAWDAHKDGYRDFNHIGVRVPIASRKEGNLRRFQRSTGAQLTHGDMDSDYRCFENLFHFLTYNHLSTRQHVINGLGIIALVNLMGGGGTMYENLSTSLNNTYVQLYGHGFFPGFGNKIRPILTVNTQINGSEDSRYYSFLNDIFNKRELELMGQEIYPEGKHVSQRLVDLRDSGPSFAIS